MKKTIMIAIVLCLALFLLAGCQSDSNTSGTDSMAADEDTQADDKGSDSAADNSDSAEAADVKDDTIPEGPHTVRYGPDGFTPKTLTINRGDKVIFVNDGPRTMWPAVDPHPTHDGYFNSSAARCGSGFEYLTFDSCEGLSIDRRYAFTFEFPGTVGYHNHVKLEHTGTIIVK